MRPDGQDGRSKRGLIGLVSIALFASIVGEALANPYESFISIEHQDDLYDLQTSQTVSDETFSQLVELLDRGVDLNTAGRDVLYALPNLTYDEVDAILELRRLQGGRIRDPSELVTTGAISAEKLYAISAFLVTATGEENALNLHGYVRMLSRGAASDRKAPPVLLQSRIKAFRHWTTGAALVLTRERLGAPTWDANRQALIASAQKPRLQLPKVYLHFDNDEFSVIAGNYGIGFGQRLVFDSTNSYNPNGITHDEQLFFDSNMTRSCKESKGELAVSPCDGKQNEFVTPDFRWQEGLFGIAGGVKQIPINEGWLQLHGWASYARRSIYQYELVNREQCQDPSDDKDPNCAAPTVYRIPDGPLQTATSQFSFQTLPNVFGELLGGANATLFINRRSHIGITGYAATERNLVGGVQLDTQEWSGLPTGRRFGAVGANVAFGFDALDVFGELAYSFDASPDPIGPATGGGGPGAIVRATWTQKHQELEGSVRYYGTDFANPYARPIAAADELNGQRARDELGARVRHQWGNPRLTLRSFVDLWITPSDKTPKIDTYLRADINASRQWRWGVRTRFQDKDLREAGRNQCYEVPTDTSEEGETVACKGQQLTSIARLLYRPGNALNATLQAQHNLVDDSAKHPTSFRHDLGAWLGATYRPIAALRFRGRVRYLFEDISDNTYLEQSLSSYLDTTYRFRQKDELRVRLDATFYLDKRKSTTERSPSPEVSLWLGYEAHF